MYSSITCTKCVLSSFQSSSIILVLFDNLPQLFAVLPLGEYSESIKFLLKNHNSEH